MWHISRNFPRILQCVSFKFVWKCEFRGGMVPWKRFEVVLFNECPQGGGRTIPPDRGTKKHQLVHFALGLSFFCSLFSFLFLDHTINAALFDAGHKAFVARYAPGRTAVTFDPAVGQAWFPNQRPGHGNVIHAVILDCFFGNLIFRPSEALI